MSDRPDHHNPTIPSRPNNGEILEAHVVRRGNVYGWPSIIWFVFWTFLFSWPFWFCAGLYNTTFSLQIWSFRFVIPMRDTFVIFGNLGPGVAALLIIGMDNGLTGIRDLLNRFKYRSGGWKLLTFVCALTPLIAITALYAYRKCGGVIVPAGSPVRGLKLIVMNLPLTPLWEELGWRGYLLPGLERRYSGVLSSFILAAIWGPWHRPLYWHQSLWFMMGFMAMVVSLSILLTWIFNWAQGSLVAPILFHGVTNATILYLLQPTINVSGTAVLGVFIGILCLAAIIVICVAGPDLSRNRLFSVDRTEFLYQVE
jgi:uncharacterized protein